MKIITILILTLIISYLSEGQIGLNLHFYNDCGDSILVANYELLDSVSNLYLSHGIECEVDHLGLYALNVSIINRDYIESHYSVINIADMDGLTDTLIFPKIRFVTTSALHTSDWNYYYCSKICNGKLTDFFRNGNKRMEGEFVNGKPKEIIEYRRNGIKESRCIYKIGKLDFERRDYYNENGVLQEYDIYKYRKKKTIKRTYDSEGNLLIEEKNKN